MDRRGASPESRGSGACHNRGQAEHHDRRCQPSSSPNPSQTGAMIDTGDKTKTMGAKNYSATFRRFQNAPTAKFI